jgi:hypothetical protein
MGSHGLQLTMSRSKADASRNDMGVAAKRSIRFPAATALNPYAGLRKSIFAGSFTGFRKNFELALSLLICLKS